MSRDWEEMFRSWGKAPGKTEQEKIENADRAIRKAIEASDILAKRDVSVFPQGSYRNRTNVSGDSDVDVAVKCTNTFFFDLPDGMVMPAFGITPATYGYAQYKNDIESALKDYLGKDAVTRGSKAFDIHENTYRLDTDALACFEYRRYLANGTYLEGTAFIPDGATKYTINWPEQNHSNGVTKNANTGQRFKAVVRILKELRSEMRGKGIEVAATIPSYLAECLVWNVPDTGFGHDTFKADVRYALAHLYNETGKDESCSEWGEINELKYLFRSSQPWTRSNVNKFLDQAWNYVGFSDD